MFIPNKTLHLIKTAAIIVLCALVSVIAVQSVLYVKKIQKIEVVNSQLDSLSVTSKSFDSTTLKKQKIVDNQITDAVTSINGLTQTTTTLTEQVNILNQSSDNNKYMIDLLVKNECQVRPYYMEKKLLEMCK